MKIKLFLKLRDTKTAEPLFKEEEFHGPDSQERAASVAQTMIQSWVHGTTKLEFLFITSID